MPYPTYKGLNIFKTKQNGIKYTKKDGSFYLKNANDGKLTLYTRKNKTGLVKNGSISLSAKSKSASFRKNKTQKRSMRSGVLNRKSCNKNTHTNRCRFVRGNERASKTCHLSIKNRCAQVPKFIRTKCGQNVKTNRCRFLRRGHKKSKACKLLNRRCVKVHKSKRRKR